MIGSKKQTGNMADVDIQIDVEADNVRNSQRKWLGG